MNVNLNNIPNAKGVDIRIQVTSFNGCESDESYQCHVLSDVTIPIIRAIMGRTGSFEIDIEFTSAKGDIEYVEISYVCGEFCACHGKYGKHYSQFCRDYDSMEELPSYLRRLFC